MIELLEMREGGVAVLTLNRPAQLNAFTPAMTEGCGPPCRASPDGTVGAVVLTGAGRGFCAGGDVKAMAAREEAPVAQRAAELRVPADAPTRREGVSPQPDRRW